MLPKRYLKYSLKIKMYYAQYATYVGSSFQMLPKRDLKYDSQTSLTDRYEMFSLLFLPNYFLLKLYVVTLCL